MKLSPVKLQPSGKIDTFRNKKLMKPNIWCPIYLKLFLKSLAMARNNPEHECLLHKALDMARKYMCHTYETEMSCWRKTSTEKHHCVVILWVRWKDAKRKGRQSPQNRMRLWSKWTWIMFWFSVKSRSNKIRILNQFTPLASKLELISHLLVSVGEPRPLATQRKNIGKIFCYVCTSCTRRGDWTNSSIGLWPEPIGICASSW